MKLVTSDGNPVTINTMLQIINILSGILNRRVTECNEDEAIMISLAVHEIEDWTWR